MILTENAAIQHSARLTAYIKERIQTQGGQITFAEYMQHALYAPGLGYYNTGTLKFGANGDFITAPELGSVFAECIAEQCSEILCTYKSKNILELGAGSGRLACDLLRSLATKNILLDNYFILELSAELRHRQQDQVLQCCPQYKHLFHWLDHLPTTPIDGVIIANEVMDAMPVARFHLSENNLQEYFVINDNDNFAYQLALPTARLNAAFAQYNIATYISQPYTSEINLWLNAWINSLSNCLHTGAILLCDYGFSRTEYYHPQRNDGTLMCHYRHRCHTDPFLYLGLQDVTAHVDFTAIAEAAGDCDLTIAGFTSLANFLLNCNLTKFVQTTTARNTQEINTLTSPAEMGELFKVIALTRACELDLIGFRQGDKTHIL